MTTTRLRRTRLTPKGARKAQRRLIQREDRAHTIFLALAKMDEDRLVYTDADGVTREVILDHSAIARR